MKIQDALRWFRPSRAELIDHVITRAAKLQAERAELLTIAECYGTLLDRCDPHTDWWRFASLKQKHCDACAEYEWIGEFALQALAEVEALTGEQ